MLDENFRSRLRKFILELRRRKVIRASIAYVVVGAGIAEGAESFLPALGAPSWAPNMVAVVVVLGFPIAMALAWAFDIVSDDGGQAASKSDSSVEGAGNSGQLLSATQLEGERLFHYDIRECLGIGGMGVVYRAQDTRLDRPVALKVLSDHLLADGDAQERFLVEARAAAALDHPNIGAVHEVAETDDGRVYIAMQYYEGDTVRHRIDQGPVPLPDALDIAVQTCRGLASAAQRGIIHRDIKPANLILTGDGAVKIVDFGLAKYAGTALTRRGARLGTVDYASPEQSRGDAVDQRTDIWSLGVVLYEMLSGTQPFRAGSDHAVVNAILTSRPESLSSLVPALPHGVVSVVERAMQKDPDRRYPDCAAFLKDLEQLQADPSCQVSLDSTPTLPAEGERRRVTVIACSIGGFDTLLESLHPDEAESALRELRAKIRSIAEDYGGVMNEFSEDNCIVLFGVPITHEDDLLRTVRAALEIRTYATGRSGLVESIALSLAVGSEQVAIRATDSGERRYRVGGTVISQTLHLARVASAGDILLGAELARAVKPFIATEQRAEVELTPGEPPSKTVAVLGESAHDGRLLASVPGVLTEFVGRSHELATLARALQETESGAGRLVTVIGDVGVGKTRLLLEFWKTLGDQLIRCTVGRCRERGMLTPLLPFIDSVKDMLGLAKTLPDNAHDNVVAKMRDLAPELETFIPAILHVLSIDSERYALPSYLEGEDLQAALAEALISVFTLGAAGNPLVMILEDWHWADEGSTEVLHRLKEMLSAYPLLVVVTSRPTQTGQSAVPTGDIHLELAPLGAEPAMGMLMSACSGARIPDDIAELIGEKTGGNPFFIEELCRMLLESGTLVIENNEVHIAGSVDRLVIPDTIEAALKSRLDRLDPEAREVLRCAAVIGRQFGFGLLSRVVPSPARLEAALESLRVGGHIQRTGLAPEPTYRFKHALTQDVTYASLLERQRMERHAQVGHAIEELYAENTEEQSSRLAAHFAAAKDWDKAIHYGLAAAARAESLWRLPETVETLVRTRGWIERSDKGAAERAGILVPLLLDLERHLEKLGRRNEQQSVIDDLRGLLCGGEPTHELGEVYLREGDLATLLDDYAAAEKLLNQALETAEQVDDANLRGRVVRSFGHLRWRQGNYEAAVPWLEQAIEHARRVDDTSRLIVDLLNLGRAVRRLDDWDRAKDIGEEALELANKTGNPVGQSYSYNYMGHLLRAMGRPNEAIEAFQEGRRLAQKARIPAREAFNTSAAAAILLEQGRLDEGLATYEDTVQLARRAHRADLLARSLILLAEALVNCGRPHEAVPHFDEAVAVLRRIGNEEPLASALTQLATAQQRAGLPTAEASWRQVVELQERLGDKVAVMAALERLAGLRRHADRSESHWMFRRALSLACELNDKWTEARIRNSLALLAWQFGELAESEKQYSKAAAILRNEDDRQELGIVLNGLGAVLTTLDRPSEAQKVLEEALATNREYEQASAEADSLAALGAAANAAGDLESAADWYQQCVEWRRKLGDRAGEGWALQRLGQVSRQAGDRQKAGAYASAALAIGRETGDKELETLATGLQSLGPAPESD
jgi:serine/threonine protein kinase/tetratricopeptide (TPR) repeat protein